MMTNGEDKAFPGNDYYNGITKRELFVAIVLLRLVDFTSTASPLGISREAVEIADATIRALNKGE